MLRVGLTGGIASGKSHVLRAAGGARLRTLDLDQAARDAVRRPAAPRSREIVAAFGARRARRRRARPRGARRAGVRGRRGARAAERDRPPARARGGERALGRGAAAGRGAGDRRGAARRDGRAPALRPAGGRALRARRSSSRGFCARDGLAERAARARIDAQMPVAEKRAFGHFVIDTSASPSDTDQAADALADALFALARQRPAAGGAALERLASGLAHGPRDGPRGLSPERILAAAGTGRGIEMQALAAALQPPATGPWYSGR